MFLHVDLNCWDETSRGVASLHTNAHSHDAVSFFDNSARLAAARTNGTAT